MSGLIALDEDWHVHSTFSDGNSTLAENIERAEQIGLRTICLVDHVRRDSAWVPDFMAAVSAIRARTSLRVYCSVEAKILDRSGELDLPEELPGIDFVHVADHRFPLESGPADPADIRRGLAARELDAADLIASLVDATEGALIRAPGGLIAHLFSILPKAGLSETDVPPRSIMRMAATAKRTGARLEVNEKWSCPSLATVRIFRAAGVPIVASTDSHHASAIGAYSYVGATSEGLQTR